METNVKRYRETVDQIDKELSAQIDYLSNVTVGIPHQSSTFTATQMKLLSEARLAAINETLHSMLSDTTYDNSAMIGQQQDPSTLIGQPQNGAANSSDETTPPPLAPAM